MTSKRELTYAQKYTSIESESLDVGFTASSQTWAGSVHASVSGLINGVQLDVLRRPMK